MNKTSGSDLRDEIINKRNLIVLGVATALLLPAMVLTTEYTLAQVLIALSAGVACYLWWGTATWWLGNVLANRHIVVMRLYDTVANVLPAVFALAFLHDKMDAATMSQGDQWGSFWIGATAVSIVSAGAALFGRALNSH